MSETQTAAMTGNPLLDGWREALGNAAPAHCWRERGIDADGYDAYKARRSLSSLYSFAVPTDEALDLIASFGPVVEIGAGTGYWARLLRERGCDVAAFDLLGDAFAKWFPTGQWGGVEVGDVDMAGVHADRTLLLIWPPMNPMATNALAAYTQAGGQRVIYIGEGMGGCTADDDFFLALGEECFRDWDEEHDCSKHPQVHWAEVQSLGIPQWYGINDWLWIYERAS